MKGLALALLLALAALPMAGCGGGQGAIVVAATTSLQESGLADALVTAFARQTGLRAKVVPVGSGQALRLGERGEADVVVAHSPQAEEEFMARGYGLERRLLMANDFLILGPPHDPAAVRGAASAAAALERIAAARAPFYSRADGSGTHAKELALWRALGRRPQGEGWYHEVGGDQARTLVVASEKGGYTLSDRGTYLALRSRLHLTVLLEGDPALLNLYHVIVVNPANGPRVNARGGKAFADFLTSPGGQELIASFGVREYGQPLFRPAAALGR
jgi:tungstate transport system substrate-binding protein